MDKRHENIPSRRRRRHQKDDQSTASIWLQRGWSFAFRKEVVGLLCLIAGALFMLAPSTLALEEPSIAWFVTPFFNVDAIRTLVSLLIIIFVLFVGMGLSSLLAGNQRRIFRQNTKTIGLGLMITSVVFALFAWTAFHFFLPASRIALAVGQSVQSLPMHHVLGRTKIMLPMQTRVSEIDIEREKVTVIFKKMDDEEGTPETIRSADPIVAGNYRFALLGFEYNPDHLQAALSTTGDKAVQQVASVGGSVRFTLEGEPLKVTAIVKDYLGVLGPAVQLESEKTGKFWVFQRGPTHSMMSNGIKVVSLEPAPLAVFSVSDSRFLDAVSPMGVAFLVGLLIFIGSKEEDENQEGATQ